MARELNTSINSFGFNPSTSSTPSVPVNVYNSDGVISDAIRIVDINKNTLIFENGQVVIGVPLGSPSMLEVNGVPDSKRGIVALSSGLIAVNGFDETGIGVYGNTTSGIAVLGSAYGTGIGGCFVSNSGIASISIGKSIVESFESGVYTSSALFEVKSTEKGSIPSPKMSTLYKDSIPAPSLGLQVFDIDRNRPEFYNGSYWDGGFKFIYIGHGAWSAPADLTTAIFGSVPISPQASVGTFSAFDIELRGSGVIRACTFNSWASGNAGSNEPWSLYIRVNTTDYLVQTISSSSSIRQFKNTSLNIPYVDGDILRMVYVNPNWITQNPAQVLGSGLITLQ